MKIKRMLVPTDFSESADYAFQYALALAREFGAALYLLHVVYSPPQPMRVVEDAARQVFGGLAKNVRRNLNTLIEKAEEREVILHPVVRVGVEYSEITAFAEQKKIDLIVMGTHGRSGLAHAVLGSVAERVVRHAPCPVLTVKRVVRKRRKAVKREWFSRSDVRHW